MKRAISFALVVLVIAAGFAGCIGSSKLSPADVTEASAEWSSEGVTEETLLSVIMTAVTTKANPTKAPTKKATTAAPREEDSSAPQAAAPQPAKTGAAFFDDAVFVGDSVTLGLKNTATAQRNAGKKYLGKAKFLCSGSLSYTNSNWSLDNPKSVHPKIKGKKVTIEDGVKALGGRKVFIMLGMNDFAAFDNDKVIKNAVSLVNKISKKSPGIQVYIQSVTPITADKQHGSFNNQKLDAFNKRLQTMCEQHGWTYVEINSLLRDENGNLNPAYCSDPQGMGIHMAQKGCDKWVNYLTSTFAT